MPNMTELPATHSESTVDDVDRNVIADIEMNPLFHK
jgi:hypothetical protein